MRRVQRSTVELSFERVILSPMRRGGGEMQSDARAEIWRFLEQLKSSFFNIMLYSAYPTDYVFGWLEGSGLHRFINQETAVGEERVGACYVNGQRVVDHFNGGFTDLLIAIKAAAGSSSAEETKDGKANR